LAEETGFPGQDIDREEIGDASGHADDEGADAFVAVGGEVLGEDAIRFEDGIGLGTGGGGRVEEGAWGTDFLFEQAQTFGFGPFGPLRGIDTGGGKELGQGAFVEGGVLSDVQSGEVESEGLEDATDGSDVVVGEACGAGVAEGLVEGDEVGFEFGRMGIASGCLLDPGELAGMQFDGKAGGEEFDGLAPRFPGVHLEEGP
jgi:hypothetical protein